MQQRLARCCCRGASLTPRVLDSEPCMTICQRLVALDASVRCRNRILPSCAILLLVVAATPAYAQEVAPPARDHAVYVELLGNGGLYSVNCERALTPALNVRVGAGAWSAESFWGGAETKIRTFPMMLQMVRGGGAHHLEAGIGVLP